MNKHLLWTGTLAIAVFAASQFPGSLTSAQSPETTKDSEKQVDRRKPLPYYFGKLGLSDEQREKLYGTQEEYEKKIAPLRDQIKSLLKERDEKMEQPLTAGQKLRLQELREEAKKKGESLEKPE